MDELHLQTLPGTSAGTRVLKLTGPFTFRAVSEFQRIVSTGLTPLTIIDLTDVPYIDSTALGSILVFHISCQKQGRKCTLAGASGRVMTLFQNAGVSGTLRFAPTIADAERNDGL